MFVPHDRIFFDARKALTLAAKVDVLTCISFVQRQVSEYLSRSSQLEKPALLALADITETLLAKAAKTFCDSENYKALHKRSFREGALELHLTAELFDWLESRFEGETQALIQKCAREFCEALVQPASRN